MAIDLLKTDLHMHSRVSDGTDMPPEILSHVKEAGIELFSLTDHDALKGCMEIRSLLTAESPAFMTGVEFSCRDEQGQYHILGYGYGPEEAGVNRVVSLGHSYRMNKVYGRIQFLKERLGVVFPQEELDRLFHLDNPGKPHIGNLMVKYGYAETREQAIKEFIDRVHFHSEYVRPEEAIRGILESHGIPVLAHPSYGSGDQLIVGKDMYERLMKLTEFGLQGVEAYYSGFTPRLRREMLGFADQFGLYVTAGSDYHGTNKMIDLMETGLETAEHVPERLQMFYDAVRQTPGFTDPDKLTPAQKE